MTIGVCSVVPLRCFQPVYFILFPPCCFSSVTYKLSANSFSTTFSRISDVTFVPNESRRSLLFASLHVMTVVLHFSALLNNFTNILTT